MSKIIKSVGKVAKGIGKAAKGIVKGIGKTFKKIVKSKLGKILLIAAAIYLTGPAGAGMWGTAGAGAATGTSAAAGMAATGGIPAATAAAGGTGLAAAPLAAGNAIATTGATAGLMGAGTGGTISAAGGAIGSMPIASAAGGEALAGAGILNTAKAFGKGALSFAKDNPMATAMGLNFVGGLLAPNDLDKMSHEQKLNFERYGRLDPGGEASIAQLHLDPSGQPARRPNGDPVFDNLGLMNARTG